MSTKSRPSVRAISGYRRKKTQYSNLAKSKAVQKYRSQLTVRDLVPSGELKFLDFVINDSIVTATGTVQQSLVEIVQGITQIRRIGRKVRIKSLHFRGLVVLPLATSFASSNDCIRMIVIEDHQVNGAMFAVTDFLNSAEIHSFRNLTNAKRFTVHWDENIDISTPGLAGDGTVNDTAVQRSTFMFNKKVDFEVEYDDSASTGAIGTQRTNGLSMLFISEVGLCGVAGIFRIRYLDK